MEGHTRVFHEGNVIFEQGREGDTLGYLVSGRIGLYLYYGQPEQFALDEIGPGASFGEMGLLSGVVRSVTAVALQESTIIEISEQELPQFVKDHPEVAMHLLQAMSKRLMVVTTELMSAHDTIRGFIEELGDRPVKKESLRQLLKRYTSFFLEIPSDIPPEVYMDYYSRVDRM